nr:MAG TPA: holin [Caudoviricetes sp.]
MTAFFGIILMAIVIEGIISYIRQLFVDRHFQWQIFVAVVIGITIAILYGLDLFALFDMVPSVPYVGMVLTGILMSRGSNYIFDLIKQIQQYSKPQE